MPPFTFHFKTSFGIRDLSNDRGRTKSQIMEGSTVNSKNVPKKSTSLGCRIMGFRQYTVRLRCEPKSLQPACIKFSNFMPILDMSIVTTHTFIISGFLMDIFTFFWGAIFFNSGTHLCFECLEKFINSGTFALITRNLSLAY